MSEFSILVVDDEEAMRKSLAAWLKKEGYRVDLAGSGAEALKKMAKFPFSLVLVDIKMDGMDGLEYHGQMNLMKGAIAYSDRRVTASDRYAEEI